MAQARLAERELEDFHSGQLRAEAGAARLGQFSRGRKRGVMGPGPGQPRQHQPVSRSPLSSLPLSHQTHQAGGHGVRKQIYQRTDFGARYRVDGVSLLFIILSLILRQFQ